MHTRSGSKKNIFWSTRTTKKVAARCPRHFSTRRRRRHAVRANSCNRRSRCDAAARRYPTARLSYAICARPWGGSRPATVSPFSPPARIRPPTGAGRSRSEGERYDAVMDDLQMIGRRNMLCGLHVHVELPDPDDRVDVMTRMMPYLPLFIALRHRRRSGARGRPVSRAIGLRPTTSCRAPACRSCCEPRRSSTPMWRRW